MTLPEKRPMVMTDIPGFPWEKAHRLIVEMPELKRVLLIQKKSAENQLVFVLEESTVSIELMDLFVDIGLATKKEQSNISWCYISKDQEEDFKSRCQKSGAEIIPLFSREPRPASLK